MRGDELINGPLVAVLSGHTGAELGEGVLQRPNGELIRLKKDFVGGVLIAADAGLFIHHKSVDEICSCDVLVSNLNAFDGALGIADLPDEKTSNEQEKDDRQQKRLKEDAVELVEIHALGASVAGSG
jgi:hypothetical protein